MKDSIYLVLKNDKLKYMLLNWNKDNFTIQNKVQVLKELLDLTADYNYHKDGKDYSKEENKYTIFATSENYYEEDKENLNGKTIVIFQEDLMAKKDKYEILEEFALKIYQVVKYDTVVPTNRPYVLRDVELDAYTKLQLEVNKDNVIKKR